MNLTTLKAQAEAARADSVELELWRESIEVDEYLRLVEVAIVAYKLREFRQFDEDHIVTRQLTRALHGIEP